VVSQHDHLMPFAATVGGNQWCCTKFRAHSKDFGILSIDDDEFRVAIYTPSVELLFYHIALEATRSYEPFDPDSADLEKIEDDEMIEEVRQAL
jgi:hypothetical protein